MTEKTKGGITESVNWQGGGGFRYYKLAPSLIVSDRWGNPVINPEYNAAMLAEALAKLEGFTYAPSEVHWWRHGHSSERDFIYVTTQNLSADQLQALSGRSGQRSQPAGLLRGLPRGHRRQSIRTLAEPDAEKFEDGAGPLRVGS